MEPGDAERMLVKSVVGHLGTVGPDGMPYVTPMNYVYELKRKKVYFHVSNKKGHLLTNLEHSNKACLEVSEADALIATGDYGCDTSQVYRSVICFGQVTPVTEEAERARVARLFIDKYVEGMMPERVYKPGLVTLKDIVLLALDVQVVTGKERTSPTAGPS
jgi:nitroimidazol reductase NimA-like FMN-containing flavoprotein (pyridoxamine 5'-phosphate oxidase superfamily)